MTLELMKPWCSEAESYLEHLAHMSNHQGNETVTVASPMPTTAA